MSGAHLGLACVQASTDPDPVEAIQTVCRHATDPELAGAVAWLAMSLCHAWQTDAVDMGVSFDVWLDQRRSTLNRLTGGPA